MDYFGFLLGLDKEKLEKAGMYASKRKKDEGFLALMIELPDHRSELENVIKVTNKISVFERNREVILVHFEQEIALSKLRTGFSRTALC